MKLTYIGYAVSVSIGFLSGYIGFYIHPMGWFLMIGYLVGVTIEFYKHMDDLNDINQKWDNDLKYGGWKDS